MADSIAPRITSLESCFSSNTSLNARANSFLVMLLPCSHCSSFTSRKVGVAHFSMRAVICSTCSYYSSIGRKNVQDIITGMDQRDLEKAALRGEPSYVWRAGQQRRLDMIVQAAGERIRGRILENGCGVGMYVEHLSPFGGEVTGLEYDFERAVEAHANSPHIVNAAGESLPLPSETFDLVLSHEVLEHVQDDRAAVCEMIRALRSPDPASGKPGWRVIIFVT